MPAMPAMPNRHCKHHIHCNRVFRNDKQNVYTFMQFWLLQLEWYMYIVLDVSSRVGNRWMHWFYGYNVRLSRQFNVG